MRPFAAVAAVGALAATGCGGGAGETAPVRGERPEPAPASGPAEPVAACEPIAAPGYRACTYEVERACAPEEAAASRCDEGVPLALRTRATVERRAGDGWRVVVDEPRWSGAAGTIVGHWEDGWLSPDGRTLLLWWSAECESPVAFFASSDAGGLRPVTGERDWRRSPEGVPRGWTADGRARVLLLRGTCGPGHREPGEYVIDPASGRPVRVGPLPGPWAGPKGR